jgi:hypothetical protein
MGHVNLVPNAQLGATTKSKEIAAAFRAALLCRDLFFAVVLGFFPCARLPRKASIR